MKRIPSTSSSTGLKTSAASADGAVGCEGGDTIPETITARRLARSTKPATCRNTRSRTPLAAASRRGMDLPSSRAEVAPSRSAWDGFGGVCNSSSSPRRSSSISWRWSSSSPACPIATRKPSAAASSCPSRSGWALRSGSCCSPLCAWLVGLVEGVGDWSRGADECEEWGGCDATKGDGEGVGEGTGGDDGGSGGARTGGEGGGRRGGGAWTTMGEESGGWCQLAWYRLKNANACASHEKHGTQMDTPSSCDQCEKHSNLPLNSSTT
eukprot:7053260-Prymnesium_polylepis.1